MTPKLRFWGVRGSFPASLPACRSLGGNTSCVQLEWQGQQLILDAGTGIRRLGQAYLEDPPQAALHLLISHPHWDHIQGFPFFAPAHRGEFELHVHSLKRPVSMRRLLADQQQATFFSISLEELEGRLTFHDHPEGDLLQIGPFEVQLYQVNHPGICTGFRIRMGDCVLAYLSDVAPVSEHLLADHLPDHVSLASAGQLLWEHQLNLMQDADFVIYDTFFTPEQYEQRSHWGHSTPEQGIAACRAAGAQSMFFFHHNAELSDDFQVQRLQDLQRQHDLPMALAREGDAYWLRAGGLFPCA